MLKTAPFSTRPLYLQVRDLLVGRIAGGEWKPGATLPNEVDLARDLNVSPGTVRRALEQMEDERLIYRQGRGTFVADHTSEELAIRFTNIRDSHGVRIAGRVTQVRISRSRASEAEQKRLRLRPHADVVRVHRVRHDERSAFMVEEVALPESLFPGLGPEREIPHRVTLLAQQFGLLLGRAVEQVRIASADAETAEALSIEENAPVLELDRVVYTLDERPVEWRLAKCHFVEKTYWSEMA